MSQSQSHSQPTPTVVHDQNQNTGTVASRTPATARALIPTAGPPLKGLDGVVDAEMSFTAAPPLPLAGLDVDGVGLVGAAKTSSTALTLNAPWRQTSQLLLAQNPGGHLGGSPRQEWYSEVR